MAPRQKQCTHPSLVVGVSPHGAESGYQRPDWRCRAAATTSSGRFPQGGPESEPASHTFTFPAPLVLPGDDLALGPRTPPQSLRSCHSTAGRNRVTYDRKTVYVARPPAMPGSMSAMSRWIEPAAEPRKKGKKGAAQAAAEQPPEADDVLGYLRAFYHGFEVKEYSPTLRFEPWEDGVNAEGSPTCFVALKEGPTDHLTRIRVRSGPDGLFSHQLNLKDLLDCAIRILPRDAFALLLLVDHDLYEDDEDEFCCGRAYGGSRVAVVSSARYNPQFHDREGVDVSHIWPASHCAAYVASQCEVPDIPQPLLSPPPPPPPRCHQEGEQRQQQQGTSGEPDSALHQAVAAFRAAAARPGAGRATSAARRDLAQGLWLFCLARTASHELGHCFCMAHCVYYACVMQGTAGLAEDCRQPPYLCPVCAGKLSLAAREAHGPGFDAQRFEREGWEVMVRFCARWKHVGAWAGYEAWLGARLQSGI